MQDTLLRYGTVQVILQAKINLKVTQVLELHCKLQFPE